MDVIRILMYLFLLYYGLHTFKLLINHFNKNIDIIDEPCYKTPEKERLIQWKMIMNILVKLKV